MSDYVDEHGNVMAAGYGRWCTPGPAGPESATAPNTAVTQPWRQHSERLTQAATEGLADLACARSAVTAGLISRAAHHRGRVGFQETGHGGDGCTALADEESVRGRAVQCARGPADGVPVAGDRGLDACPHGCRPAGGFVEETQVMRWMLASVEVGGYHGGWDDPALRELLEVGLSGPAAAGLFGRFLRRDRSVTGELYARLTALRA